MEKTGICEGDLVQFKSQDDLEAAMRVYFKDRYSSSYKRDILALSGKQYIVENNNCSGQDIRLTGLHDTYGFNWRIIDTYLTVVTDKLNKSVAPLFGSMNYA